MKEAGVAMLMINDTMSPTPYGAVFPHTWWSPLRGWVITPIYNFRENIYACLSLPFLHRTGLQTLDLLGLGMVVVPSRGRPSQLVAAASSASARDRIHSPIELTFSVVSNSNSHGLGALCWHIINAYWVHCCIVPIQNPVRKGNNIDCATPQKFLRLVTTKNIEYGEFHVLNELVSSKMGQSMRLIHTKLFNT